MYTNTQLATFFDLEVMISKLYFGCHKELNCSNRKEKSKFVFLFLVQNIFCALCIYLHIFYVFTYSHICIETQI